jgi:pimeloyl-ACP methyl ester carboxylesterase
VNSFASFDGIRIAFHDEGEGPAVILLHGFGVDGLGQFGEFERILPILEKRQEMLREVFGGAPPLPNPPLEGRPELVRALLAAGARTILPDLRGFGVPTNPERKPPTQIQHLLGMSSLSLTTSVWMPLT